MKPPSRDTSQFAWSVHPLSLVPHPLSGASLQQLSLPGHPLANPVPSPANPVPSPANPVPSPASPVQSPVSLDVQVSVLCTTIGLVVLTSSLGKGNHGGSKGKAPSK